MLNHYGFVGELAGKTIHSFTTQLDYTINSTQDRLKKINDILYTNDKKIDDYFVEFFNQDDKNTHFNVHLNTNNVLSEKNFVCNQLEYMANYLLFNKETMEENKESEYPYLNQNQKMQIKRRQRFLEDKRDKCDKHGVDLITKAIISAKNFKLKPITKITKEDLNDISYINDIQNVIDRLKDRLNHETDNNKDKFKIRLMLRDLRKEQVDIKNSIRKPISFLSALTDSTKYCYDGDTGYYDDKDDYKYVSYNQIDFFNPKHIYQLLKFYSPLKERFAYDLCDDMKYIIMDLENLISQVEWKPYEKDVLTLKIDGLQGKEIIKRIKQKYNITLSDNGLSIIWRKTIPNKIVAQYKKEYEEWFYTYKAKGEYKTCTKCKKVYLANKKYFGRHPYTLDKLQSVCKKCDYKRHLRKKE